MDEKRSIDRIRESGGYTDIGSDLDGAIIEMKSIGDRLIIIKEKSIYETIYADTIDPERTNINLPPFINKLIIDKGTESETVSRTLLTALRLFKPEYISSSVDCDKVLGLTIDMLSEISILQDEINTYQQNEDKVSSEYENRRGQKGSYEIPSVVNIESRCKTIFQKADHIEQILMDIITRFYPDQGLIKQSHFPKFHEIIKEKFGADDPFSKFIDGTLYFMVVVREIRNGLDHRLNNTKVTDFQLQIGGNIISPTIELKHREIKLRRTSLSDFLNIINTNILDIIETTFAYLAEKNVKKSGMLYQVRLIPDDKRHNKFIKYCFWMPVGEDGYYIQ